MSPLNVTRFTLNIGPHEVAFSIQKPIDNKFQHYIVLDRLITDYPETVIWIGKHDGEVREAEYATAREAFAPTLLMRRKCSVFPAFAAL